MFYKSSILTASFALLSIGNTTFYPERAYANTTEVNLNRAIASDYDLDTSNLITPRPKPEEIKVKLDPLDIDRISKHTKLNLLVNAWGNVGINSDLPPAHPRSLFAKGDDSQSLKQVQPLAQLIDVETTDWEFQSLQSLNERYNCLVGDGDTFKNSQGLTRDEFAASLKICLDQIDKSLASDNTKLASNDDSETLKRLREEFAPELSKLHTRTKALDARVATLESQQFSTTTKLFGQAIIGVQGRAPNQADLFPRDGIRETQDPGTNLNLINTLQLNLLTQFENRSFLLAGFQTGSGSTFPSLTNNTRLGYEGPTNGSLILSDLTYRFPVTNKFAAYVGTVGVNPVTAFRGPNRVASAGSGPISYFAQRNPILNIGFGSAGAGFDWQFSEKASIQSVYAASTASNPAAGNGLFNGGYVMGTQLVYTPVPPVDISLYYLNSYSPLGFLGTGTGDDQLVPITGQSAPLMTHAVGTTINWQVNPKLTMGGWLGYTNSSVPSLPGAVETTNWMAYLNFPDLFGRGNLGGIYVGQPPKITSSNLPTGLNIPNLFKDLSGTPGGQPGTTTHLEAFYRWQVADNISITPGILFIFQPRHTRDSDTITEMAIRTTFTF